MTNKDRIIEISKKLKLTHVGSCLSVLPILEEIYNKRQAADPVLMDNGHASLAQYVVLESLGGKDAEEMFHKHGVHANRDIENGLWGSNGSLGHSIGIGIGMALADKSRNVYVTVSDGSVHEGSNYEAFRIANEYKLMNLHIYCNFNGYTAVKALDTYDLERVIRNLAPILDIKFWDTDNGLPELEGLQGHYKTL